MIDIDPPHASIETWRDILIHLAIIVCGILIAIGLEQTAEAIHHHHERRDLRADLHSEAEQKIPLLHQNEVVAAAGIAWYRQILRAGRDVSPSAGFVTFVLPPRRRTPTLVVIEDAVWPAAKSSGSVDVLSREEIETWDEVDYLDQITSKGFQGREDALQQLYAVTERTGIAVAPGGTVRLSPADRDELMRALSNVIEATWMLERDFALWEGACHGVLHGAKSTRELEDYEGRTLAAMPR
jgi:hypothetical protein